MCLYVCADRVSRELHPPWKGADLQLHDSEAGATLPSEVIVLEPVPRELV